MKKLFLFCLFALFSFTLQADEIKPGVGINIKVESFRPCVLANTYKAVLSTYSIYVVKYLSNDKRLGNERSYNLPTEWYDIKTLVALRTYSTDIQSIRSRQSRRPKYLI